jgi:arylsulfatase A-like enzyme
VSCRNMWLLAMGAGVARGESEEPVHHIDVAATAAELLGVRTTSMSGRPLKQVL